MTAPLVLFTGCCFGKIPAVTSSNSNKCSLGDKFVIALPITDALVSIIALILGILGATSVIAMPVAAAYALIGVSGGITLLWIAMAISRKFCPKATDQNRFRNSPEIHFGNPQT